MIVDKKKNKNRKKQQNIFMSVHFYEVLVDGQSYINMPFTGVQNIRLTFINR